MEQRLDNKFYVPELSEFHMGFEYERIEPVLVDKGWHKIYTKQWVPKIADERYIMHYYGGWEFKRDLEDKLIRIKYLCKEDIVDLGFKYISSKYTERDASGKLVERERNGYKKDLGHYELLLSYFESTKYVLIRLVPEDEHNYCSTRFLGVIKNKSELKQLLKQLKIK